jgi:hypothetical protein
MVRLVGPPKLAGVHGYRWTVSRLTSAVPPDACLDARGVGLAAEAAKPALDQIKAAYLADLLGLIQDLYIANKKTKLSRIPLGLGTRSASTLQSEYFSSDMPWPLAAGPSRMSIPLGSDREGVNRRIDRRGRIVRSERTL